MLEHVFINMLTFMQWTPSIINFLQFLKIKELIMQATTKMPHQHGIMQHYISFCTADKFNAAATFTHRISHPQ